MDNIPHSTHRNDKVFQWRQCDESAEKTCEMLLDKGDVESCRLHGYLVYVHGYLECICSVPISIMSNQGLAFYDRAACILKIMSQSVGEASSHSSASGEDLVMREVNAWNSLAQVWQSFSKVNLLL